MSCPPQLSRPEVSDSSDYGSDFTPDEEQLLNDLVTKAAAEHATVQRDATPVSTPTPNQNLEEAITTPVAAKLADLDSLQPASLAEIVADIEDAVTNSPGVRLPKVLGREKPGSPWRRSSQRPWPGPTSPRSPMAGRSSQGSNNRSAQIGMSVPDPVIPKDLRFTIHRPWVKLTRGSRSV
jgi:exonuclease V